MGSDWADDTDDFSEAEPRTADARPMESPSVAPLAPQPSLPMYQAPPQRARARAGLSLLMAAAGTGVGAALGGVPGAGAGLLLAGATRNLYRGQAGLGSDESGEAAKSLTLGILGLAAGGYLVYRCFRKKD